MYERVGEEIKRRVRFLVIRRTLLTAVLVIAAVGSNNGDLVAPAIIAGIIVIIWVYSSARLQYLLLYGYGELIDKVSDLEARSQGGKKGGRKPQRPAESHTEPNAEPEPEPEQPEKKSSGGLLVIVLLLALAGGGAFAYVKFIKPKQGVKVSADPDDYDFEDEEYLTEDESGDIKDN